MHFLAFVILRLKYQTSILTTQKSKIVDRVHVNGKTYYSRYRYVVCVLQQAHLKTRKKIPGENEQDLV